MRRWCALLMAGCWCVVLLAACSTGNAESANEAATHEAGRATNVVANIEATQVVREFFEQKQTPTPFPTERPALANLRLTTAVREENAPTNTVYTYTRGSGPLYADAQVANVFPGQRVVAVWSTNGTVMQTTEVDVDNPHELIWIALRWDIPPSAPTGQYTVAIQVAGPGTNDEGTPADVTTEIGTLVFRVN